MTRAVLIVIAALLVPGNAHAGGMQLAPVIVELDSHAPSVVVTVRNGGSTPMRYQATTFSWRDVGNGESKLEPSQELAVFPPLFQLGAGQERRIRVGATVPSGDVERAWRLFIEELPSPREPGGTPRINLRTRFALPVFLAPVRVQKRGSLGLSLAAGSLEIRVKNDGNVHFRPESLTVALLGDGEERLNEQDVVAATLLAGAESTYEVSVPRAICARVRSATAIANLSPEKVEAALALPGGACAP